MKVEDIQIWGPIESVPKQLYLDFIKEDHDGLVLVLRGENSDNALLIQFSSFISYSNTEESFRLESLNDTPLLSTEWPLFVSHKSGYIEWLISQNYKMTLPDQMRHYVITHGNGIIDIVSHIEPVVKWI